MATIKLIFIYLIFLLPTSIFAERVGTESLQQIIKQGIKDSEVAVKNVLTKEKIINEAEQKYEQSYTEVNLAKNQNLSGLKTQIHQNIKPVDECAVFVSFSMPEPSLKQIVSDASYYNVPVVIRGLYNNSFRETANKILALTKENNKGGMLINPIWFRKYNIKAVPAFLVTKNKESSSYDLVYGNIPLKRALTIIAEKGEHAKEAAKILERKGL